MLYEVITIPFNNKGVKIMNRKLPEISESAAGLAMLMKKEKKGRLRDRLRVLWLLKTGQARNRQEASELTGLHRTTVGKWLVITSYSIHYTKLYESVWSHKRHFGNRNAHPVILGFHKDTEAAFKILRIVSYNFV